eukprot:359269-Chlamydomonas_euryale.AAC.1
MSGTAFCVSTAPSSSTSAHSRSNASPNKWVSVPARKPAGGSMSARKPAGGSMPARKPAGRAAGRPSGGGGDGGAAGRGVGAAAAEAGDAESTVEAGNAKSPSEAGDAEAAKPSTVAAASAAPDKDEDAAGGGNFGEGAAAARAAPPPPLPATPLPPPALPPLPSPLPLTKYLRSRASSRCASSNVVSAPTLARTAPVARPFTTSASSQQTWPASKCERCSRGVSPSDRAHAPGLQKQPPRSVMLCSSARRQTCARV